MNKELDNTTCYDCTHDKILFELSLIDLKINLSKLKQLEALWVRHRHSYTIRDALFEQYYVIDTKLEKMSEMFTQWKT